MSGLPLLWAVRLATDSQTEAEAPVREFKEELRLDDGRHQLLC